MDSFYRLEVVFDLFGSMDLIPKNSKIVIYVIELKLISKFGGTSCIAVLRNKIYLRLSMFQESLSSALRNCA